MALIDSFNPSHDTDGRGACMGRGAPWKCAWQGACMAEGVCGRGHPWHTHPPLNRITDMCKNITFPQLRLRAVINKLTRANVAFILLSNNSPGPRTSTGTHEHPVTPPSPPNVTYQNLTPKFSLSIMLSFREVFHSKDQTFVHSS